MSAWQPLLDWWFGDTEAAASVVAANRQGLWFGYRAEQDDEARRLFGEPCAAALAGALQDWAELPQGWLALILLLDQLPRMIHRSTPQAFSGDVRAQALVRQGLELGLDTRLPAICRVFPYLVLEHAEDLALQDEAAARFAALREQVPADQRAPFDGYLDYAERHRQVIRRFGRFPHRNDSLGRTSTAEELAFLEQPGSRF
ncbi:MULTISPECIES: DUF924 domain-containing protein [unclassified Pseudomonas]|uniref:DUF924 family protein n=1 Tax=unclassified Pseudomonas TaxID=196821 RepID=UPI0024489B50|nr:MULTISPECIES: DUF924 domain-containing protein [unclassified Pseudomonas]MDG9925951.1 DUF924 domain-containing protein [Pseudomonas sp. GD04045]MDH0034855.1 DUF924 domain-containing protein [Pseudomonas sp. GD04019]